MNLWILLCIFQNAKQLTIVNIVKCDSPQRIHILWLIEHELLPKTIHASYYIMIFMLCFVKYSIENHIWIYSQITIQTKLKLSFETILWNISMQIQLKSFQFMFNSTAHQFPSPSQVFICLINSSNIRTEYVEMLWNVIISSDMLRLSNKKSVFFLLWKSKYWNRTNHLLLQKVSFVYWSCMVWLKWKPIVLCSVKWQHAVFFQLKIKSVNHSTYSTIRDCYIDV